jgi:hypothetical protein
VPKVCWSAASPPPRPQTPLASNTPSTSPVFSRNTSVSSRRSTSPHWRNDRLLNRVIHFIRHRLTPLVAGIFLHIFMIGEVLEPW